MNKKETDIPLLVNRSLYGFMSDGESTWRLNPDKLQPREAGIAAIEPDAWEWADKTKTFDRELPFEPLMAFCAFRYCLGRMTYVVGSCADYLIAHADKIPSHDKALIISEINTAILDGNAGWDMDIDQWERLRARLSVTYKVHINYKGKGSHQTCYQWKGNYYLPDMRTFVAPEYIISVDEPLVYAED